jgi:hypothetical protein
MAYDPRRLEVGCCSAPCARWIDGFEQKLKVTADRLKPGVP